ncbi:type II secretion system F family protein [Streptomyces sp. N2-109]|uniref:Type II secretion system F family protein n=1 Tax=Streptomyces gossypii TaxID=2883101 RepID=A0ABT2JPV6_9ACTN|nr:type II secretion system F family protein [Streptomyces gossypii]MCT2589913.1 type II secretion system F family protein [Streptomyces gossypii]
MTGAGVSVSAGGPGAEAFPVCAAMLCAGVAAWLMAGGHAGPRRARLVLAGSSEAPLPGARRSPVRNCELQARLRRRFGTRARHQWWFLPAGVVLALVGESPLPALAGALAVPLAARSLATRDRRRTAERRETAVIGLCAAVAGELRAGLLPDQALLTAGPATLGEEGSSLLAAARFGGDVPAALRETASLPGAEGLRGAAACWQVSADGGAGLAAGLDRVAGALQAEHDQREELRSQLAGPRSTALVLALLPLFGLFLGSAMGAEPLRVLLHTAPGLACLAVGGLLEWAGLAWVARLVRVAEGGGPP